MSPVFETKDGWTHILTDGDEVFESEQEAWEDWRRKWAAAASCKTGGCDE